MSLRGWVVGCASALASIAFGCSRHTYTPPASAVFSKLSLGVHRHVLSNGLEVILAEDHHAALVAVDVWYHVGSRDDPPQRSGMAHLFEHLLYDGGKHVGRGGARRWLGFAGAREHNAETDVDHTSYHETVPSDQLDVALWLESDRMGFFLEAADQKLLDRERAIVLNERREHYEQQPFGLVPTFARAALYPHDHPYHRSTIGEPDDLARVTLDEVRAFYARYYVPDDATLVVVGDIDEGQTLAAIRRWFEPIPRGDKPLERWPKQEITLDHERTQLVEADVPSPRIVYTWPAPPRYRLPDMLDVDGATRFVGGVLLDELGAQRGDLVDAGEGARSVWYGFDWHELASDVSITVALPAGQDPIAGRATIDETMQRLSAYRFARNDVLRSAISRASTFVLRLEELGHRADAINEFAWETGDPSFAAKFVDALEDGDPSRWRDAYRDWLVQANAVVTFVEPVAGAPRAGRVAWVR